MTAPTSPSATALRPRSGSELIDAAFVILRRHYTEFVAIMAVFLVPGIVLGLLLPGDAGGRVAEIIIRLLSIPAAGAVIAAASDSYLGREVTVGGSARLGASRWLSLWGAAIIQGVLLLIGLVLLIVPGLIFFAWTAVMPAVVMLEPGAGAGDSFRRSRDLARGDVMRILGMIGLTTILVFMLTFAVAAGIALLGGAGADGESRLAEAAGNIVTILVYPIVPVVTTLLYYDLRIRKEGFDLELLADSLDPAARKAAPDDAAAAARRANWS